MIKISFPDGAVREFEQGITPFQIAQSISEGLARKIIVATVNGIPWDLSRPITEDAAVKLLSWNDTDGK